MSRGCVLSVCAMVVLMLAATACEGARQAGSGAKATGRGVLAVLEYPSKLLAGNPPDYAKKQGMTAEDLAADAPPETTRRELKKKTDIKPTLMGTGS